VNRDLVVVGGSTGAVAPLRKMLNALPETFPAAILVVLHIPETSTGIFRTVLGAAGRLPVQAAEDGMRIMPGRIYLGVPSHHLIVVDGHMRLGNGPRENLVRPAIDPLFRSAAVAYGPRTIGVILSGMLNDGADGLRAIKRCGGVAMVQAPSDCEALDMPLAALEVTSIDLSVDAAALGDGLLRVVREPAGVAFPPPLDIKLEVEIALGAPVHSDDMEQLATPIPITCPDCGGVLSEIVCARPLRFRCQVGHGYTARALAQTAEGSVDEAMRVALRIIEERAELVSRMSREASEVGRQSMAELYAQRASEYRGHAGVIRQAVLANLVARGPIAADEQLIRTQGLVPEQLREDGLPST
jgi:two-component system chemotaxis response regulator CheB